MTQEADQKQDQWKIIYDGQSQSDFWEIAGSSLSINGNQITKKAGSSHTAYSKNILKDTQTISDAHIQYKIKFITRQCCVHIGIASETNNAESDFTSSQNSYSMNTSSDGTIQKYASNKLENGDIITVDLDLKKKQLSFWKNNICLGIAFENINTDNIIYRLAVWSDSALTACIQQVRIANDLNDVFKPDTNDSKESEMIQIFVKISPTQTITLDIESTSSIQQLKEKIQEKQRILYDQQCLTFEYQQLQDIKYLIDYNINNKSCITLSYLDPSLFIQNNLFDKQRIQLSEKLLSSKIFHDTTFIIGKSPNIRHFRCLRAHLAVISSVFAAQLFGELAIPINKPIKIPDMKPAVFECILNTSYGLRPNITDDIAIELIFACTKYKIELLINETMEFMRGNLNENNILPMINKAHKYNCFDSYKPLRNILMTTIETHSTTIIKNPYFWNILPNKIRTTIISSPQITKTYSNDQLWNTIISNNINVSIGNNNISHVTVSVGTGSGTQTINASIQHLSRISPILKTKIIQSQTIINQNQPIVIPNMSTSVFETIVRTSYGLAPVINDINVVELIHQSTIYEIPSLINAGMEYIETNITTRNVRSFISTAYEYNNIPPKLIKKCVHVICQNSNSFLQNDLFWNNLHSKAIISIVETPQFNVKEQELWERLVKWATDCAQKTNKKSPILDNQLEDSKVEKEVENENKLNDNIISIDEGKDEEVTVVTKSDNTEEKEPENTQNTNKNENEIFDGVVDEIRNDPLNMRIFTLLQPIIPYVRFYLMKPAYYIDNVKKWLTRSDSDNVFAQFLCPERKNQFKFKTDERKNVTAIMNNINEDTKEDYYYNNSDETNVKLSIYHNNFKIAASSVVLDSALELNIDDVNACWPGSDYSMTFINSEIKTKNDWFIMELDDYGKINEINWKNHFDDKDCVKDIIIYNSNDDKFMEWTEYGRWTSHQTINNQVINLPEHVTFSKFSKSKYWKFEIVDTYGGSAYIDNIAIKYVL